MTEELVDSRTAARLVLRVILIAVVVGGVCGLATFAFIALDHLGVNFLWEQLPHMVPNVPSWAIGLGVVALFTGLATVTVVLSGTRPFDTGEAEAEYDRNGRMEYRHILAGAAFSLFSLYSGAAVGPEAPLTDINGGLGTLIAERLQLKPTQVKVMAYSGVAGAFGAFFGSAPVGALLAAELINPKATTLDRTMIVAGLASGATGWVVYESLGGQKVPLLLTFPGSVSPTLAQLAMAVALGALGGLLGLAYGAGFVKLRVALQRLRSRPWLAALAGGALIGLASVASPYLLFSGQEEVGHAIQNAAAIGVLMLIGLGIGKLILSVWSLSTAYFGGPIFPLIFAGTCFGLAVNLALPSVPQGVAVLAVVAGMVASAAVAPLSVTVFLALMSDPSLVSVIAIATVSAFIVRQAIAPTLPGVYRAARAAEAVAAGGTE